jgi:hypothetical protein
MRRNGWTAIAFFWAVVGVGQAATVRGKLLRGNGAASGVEVTVLNSQKVRTQPAYSGANGMYYIPNVKPGSYTLEVWATPNKSPLTVPIQVKEPETDVNPVKLP